ncbi:MAG: hypothetical protein ACOYOP_13660 [Microthrixaceae bacterium]
MTVGLLAIAGAACTRDPAGLGDPTARNAGSEGAEKVLMSLTGTAATATPAAGSTTPGVEQAVILQGTGDVLVFTDRPQRHADTVGIRRFVAAWPKVFAGDPPNAVIAGTLPDGSRTQLAVEVRGANVAGEVPTFRVHGIGADRDRQVPGELRDVSLFIDDTTVPVCGPSGDGPQAQELCTTEIVYANTWVPFDSSF